MGSSIDITRLLDAQKRLNDFLNEYPHMRKYQEEIDKRLEGAGWQHNRMAILKMMMVDKVYELQGKFQEIQDLCQKALNVLK